MYTCKKHVIYNSISTYSGSIFIYIPDIYDAQISYGPAYMHMRAQIYAHYQDIGRFKGMIAISRYNFQT